ncbi:hypothetical protein GF326_00210 [Candidatus Bathyarchaeota archaeon]|nr:hypothetical protein [Candidatus Bathyarchaeota archaeon]
MQVRLYGPREPITGNFARWDAGWYLYIAEHGYDKKLLYAFRPIYPTILHITHRILGGEILKITANTGFIWNLSMLLAATLLIALTATLYQTIRSLDLKDTRTHYMLWGVALLTIFTLVGDLKSWTRYTLTIIPVYWSIAEITKNREWLNSTIVISFTSIMVYGTIAYVNWYHFL